MSSRRTSWRHHLGEASSCILMRLRSGSTTNLAVCDLSQPSPWSWPLRLWVACWSSAEEVVHRTTRRQQAQRSGTWKLADDVLSGTWQQNTKGGPPPGVLSCPNTSVCYTMSGQYASPNEGAPLLSVSLYASTDTGVTWSAYSMPQGFAPTSPLACSGTSTCAAGGTDNGRPVLITTTDGGHSFAIDPLPAGVGHLDTLSCPSTEFCAGLAASSEYLQIGTTDATFLSTSDGGKTFTDSPIIAGDSMQSLACSSSVDCTAVGWDDALGQNDLTAGVAARTTDGGHTWAAGTLPAGLGITYLSQLSCADALHCSVTGTIAIAVQNPPECAKLPQRAGGTTLPASVQSSAVRAISQVESRIATNAALKEAESGKGFSCNPNGQSLVGDIASTSDGGALLDTRSTACRCAEPDVQRTLVSDGRPVLGVGVRRRAAAGRHQLQRRTVHAARDH